MSATFPRTAALFPLSGNTGVEKFLHLKGISQNLSERLLAISVEWRKKAAIECAFNAHSTLTQPSAQAAGGSIGATMRKSSNEKIVRRNLTLPESFARRLEALTAKRGGLSESEVFRQAISVLEAITESGRTVVLRDKKTGAETEVIVP
jgi:hypothetical protein